MKMKNKKIRKVIIGTIKDMSKKQDMLEYVELVGNAVGIGSTVLGIGYTLVPKLLKKLL